MKTCFLGTICLGFWLAATPASTQAPNRPANPEKAHQTAVPPPLPPPAPRATTPEEKAHQAMVEEQERRDREAEAERDRDDL